MLELTVYQRSISNLLLQRALPTSTGLQHPVHQRRRACATAASRPRCRSSPVPRAPVEWTIRATLHPQPLQDHRPARGVPRSTSPTVGFGAGLGAFRIEEGKSATQIVANDSTATASSTTVGNGEPDFRMGWSNNVHVGDFGLPRCVDWQKGSEIVNLTRFLYDFGQHLGRLRRAPARRGSRRSAAATCARTSRTRRFVKLREIVALLRPAQEDRVEDSARSSTLRVSLSGRNLFTFTDYSRSGSRGLELRQPADRSQLRRRALSAEPQLLVLDRRGLLKDDPCGDTSRRNVLSSRRAGAAGAAGCDLDVPDLNNPGIDDLRRQSDPRRSSARRAPACSSATAPTPRSQRLRRLSSASWAARRTTSTPPTRASSASCLQGRSTRAARSAATSGRPPYANIRLAQHRSSRPRPKVAGLLGRGAARDPGLRRRPSRRWISCG